MTIVKSGVILFDPGTDRILLVRGKKFMNEYTGYIFPDGMFSFPKGYLEEDETFSHCALRELKEETGIKLTITRNDPSVVLSDGVYFIKVIDPKTIKPRIQDRREITKITWKFVGDLRDSFTCNRAVREFVKKYESFKKLVF